jgi:hypothetical protein
MDSSFVTVFTKAPPPPYPVLSQLNSLHSLTSLFFPILFNVIFHLPVRLWSHLLLGLPNKISQFSSLLCMLHAPPISCSVIWSLWLVYIQIMKDMTFTLDFHNWILLLAWQPCFYLIVQKNYLKKLPVFFEYPLLHIVSGSQIKWRYNQSQLKNSPEFRVAFSDYRESSYSDS